MQYFQHLNKKKCTTGPGVDDNYLINYFCHLSTVIDNTVHNLNNILYINLAIQ